MSITQTFSSNALWIEKYRPKTLDELVADNKFKEVLETYINDPKSMPHQIYIGSPGSGKTTTARILIDKIITQKDDVIILNGSEQKGIQVVRDLILEFVKVPPIFSPIKIVFIDEADNLTPDAWKSLRFIMENYSNNAKFILTGNIDNFPDYIKSRSSVRYFKSLDKNYMFNFAKHILDNEGIQYNDNDIKQVIDLFYPDLRKIVTVLQDISKVNKQVDVNLLDNVLSSDDKVLNLTKQLIHNALLYNVNDRLVKSLIYDISQITSTSYVDYYKVFKDLFKSITFEAIPIKLVISKYANQLNKVLEPSMLYFEFIYELTNTCNQLIGQVNPNLVFSNANN